MTKVFKISKVKNKKDELLIGHFEKLTKEANERLDKYLLKLLIGRHGKKWVKSKL